jgi:drug/metabolite transporter (DMT)-like permease
VAIGWLLFGDLPDAWTWAGILVIVGSGVFVTLWTSRRAAEQEGGRLRPPNGQAAAG